MKYRNFGKTDLKVSEVGFGAWAIGGMRWGSDVNDTDSVAALEKAYELGINFFDTCDAYGDGHSEELIGKIFNKRRSKIILATKGGTNYRLPERTKTFTKDYLLYAFDDSLKRLKTDYVDIFLFHSPNMEQIKNSDIFEVLEILRKSGKARTLGLSLGVPEEVEESMRLCNDIDVFELPFNIINQKNKRVFSALREKGIALIIKEPLANGMLTGKYNSNTVFDKNDWRGLSWGWTPEKINALNPALEKIKTLTKPPFKTMAQLAISFTLGFDEVTSVIPGAKRPSQVEDNVSSSGLKINADDFKQLVELS